MLMLMLLMMMMMMLMLMPPRREAIRGSLHTRGPRALAFESVGTDSAAHARTLRIACRPGDTCGGIGRPADADADAAADDDDDDGHHQHIIVITLQYNMIMESNKLSEPPAAAAWLRRTTRRRCCLRCPCCQRISARPRQRSAATTYPWGRLPGWPSYRALA